MATMLIHDPEGVIASTGQLDVKDAAAVPTGSLRIGFVDNGKPNAAVLVETLAELVAARVGSNHPVVGVSKWGDGDGAASMRPILPEKHAWLIKECDVILYGSGD